MKESETAKGQVLSALCRAFDSLEERKRILRMRPHPDVIARVATLTKNVEQFKDKRVSESSPFPEPTEPPEPEHGADHGADHGTGQTEYGEG